MISHCRFDMHFLFQIPFGYLNIFSKEVTIQLFLVFFFNGVVWVIFFLVDFCKCFINLKYVGANIVSHLVVFYIIIIVAMVSVTM